MSPYTKGVESLVVHKNSQIFQNPSTMGLVGAFGFTQQGKPCLQQSAALSVTSLSCIARLRRVATGDIATGIVLQLCPRKNPLNHDHDRAKQAWKASLNMSYIKAINWWNSLKYPLVNSHSYWTWPFIVDFPIKNGDVPVRYVKLPEGTPACNWNFVLFRCFFLALLPVERLMCKVQKCRMHSTYGASRRHTHRVHLCTLEQLGPAGREIAPSRALLNSDLLDSYWIHWSSLHKINEYHRIISYDIIWY